MTTRYNTEALCASLRWFGQPATIRAAEVIESLEKQVLSLAGAPTPSAAVPSPEGADCAAELRVIGDALLAAHDHLEMHKLERSHCNSAAAIRAGLATYSAWKKRPDLAAPAPAEGDDARERVERLKFELRQAMIDYGSAERANDPDRIRETSTRGVALIDSLAPISEVQPKGPVFLARDVAELLGIGVPELSAALVALGFPRRSQGMVVEPLEALAVRRARASQSPAPADSLESIPHVIEERDAYAKELARCRDAFPIPEPGAAHENAWMLAMGDPLAVADYVTAALSAVPCAAVGAGDERQDVGGHIRAAANARVAQQADDDTRRLDYLQKKQATISLVPDGRDEKGTRHAFMVGGWHCSVNRDVRASIDAAMGESQPPVQGSKP